MRGVHEVNDFVEKAIVKGLLKEVNWEKLRDDDMG